MSTTRAGGAVLALALALAVVALAFVAPGAGCARPAAAALLRRRGPAPRA